MTSIIAPWRIKAARSLLSAIGLGVGGLMMWVVWVHQMEDSRKVAGWVKTPCRIDKWTVEVVGRPPHATSSTSIIYQYEFDGKTYRAQNFDETTDREIDLREFEKEGARARKGPAFCHVDPADPATASFLGPRLWHTTSVFVGGSALALISLIFLILTFLPKRRTRSGIGDGSSPKAIYLIGLTMIGVGIFVANKQNLGETIQGQMLRSKFIQIPAKIEGNGVSQAKGSGKQRNLTFNMVSVLYSYEHDGRRWCSNRIYFDDVSVNGGTTEQAEALAASYPAGLETMVWIDPERPWLATLRKGLSWTVIFHIMPIGMIAGGMAVMRMGWRMRKRH